MPGLWDMHAHMESSGGSALQLYVANGVTGIRDMGSALDIILELRDATSSGRILGPRIVAAGPILDDAPEGWPGRMRVRTAEDGRSAVQMLKRRGVDLIKVHDRTPRDAFFAIADEARRQNLPLAGHVPFGVTLEEAIDVGHRDVQHLQGLRLWASCSGGAGTRYVVALVGVFVLAVIALVVGIWRPKNPRRRRVVKLWAGLTATLLAGGLLVVTLRLPGGLSRYDAGACRPLVEMLADRGVWQTPTLLGIREISTIGTPASEVSANQLTYVSTSLKRMWAENQRLFVTPEVVDMLRSGARIGAVVTSDMAKAGVGILAGCDGLVPGFCVHDELAAMVAGGMTPREALQTATINPARYLGRQDSLGRVMPGYEADLVLLDANPLMDIANVRAIRAVLVSGRLLDRKELDEVLGQVKIAAGQP
jgi:hypothetical protein